MELQMSKAVEIWQEIMPEIKNAVTGVGIWTALNQSKAVALEDGIFVLGLPHESNELSGHLRMHATKMLIERTVSTKLGSQIELRVIDGVSENDWEIVKRKDNEARRLQQLAIERARAEIESRTSWDSIYDQLSRVYASFPNRSLPQYRARFLREAVKLIRDARDAQPITDDLGERNYARCLDRVSQYTELPPVLIALYVEGE